MRLSAEFSPPQLEENSPIPPSPANPASRSLRKERRLVALVILFLSATFLLIEYDRLRGQGPGLAAATQGILDGRFPAPEQYRIGIPLLIHVLDRRAHLAPVHSYPLIEAAPLPAALTLLYILFTRSPTLRAASSARRTTLLALLLATVQLPIAWIAPWGRPETLPSTLYLAALVVLIACPIRIPTAAAFALAVALSLLQSLMRADIAVAAGLSILVAATLQIPLPRPRSSTLTLGLLCAGIGGATQIFLQRVAFPRAAYPSTSPRLQLPLNLLPPSAFHRLPSFLIALLPLASALYLLRRRHLPLDPSDKLVLLLCASYLPLWLLAGNLGEVRIFVPFLFLAAPTVAKLWAAYLLPDPGSRDANPAARFPS